MASLVPWRRPNADRTASSRPRLCFSLLPAICETQAGSCVVVTEPAIQPRVRARSNMRVPDVAVTCSPVEAGQIALPDPLLVVEILSPTNESDTWENVWTYVVDSQASRRCWCCRSASIAADLLRRRTDGTWPDEPIQIGRGDMLHLECIGLTSPLADLYIGTYLGRSA